MNTIAIVADESVDFRIIQHLRLNSFPIFSILETTPSISDAEVLTIAIKQNALLVTEDKDFGEMVFRFGMKHCGILLIRLIEMQFDEKQRLTLNALRQYGEELQNSFAVLNESKLRIRK